MTMKLFNTMSGQKEEFKPLGPEVTMYYCGITPYASSHMGHAMSAVIFDVLRRYLEYRGYRVKHVQNFTDIEDKIIERANHLGVSFKDLADRYVAEYFDVLDALNVQRAHIYPRATEEISNMLEMIQRLVAQGDAYPSAGDVYFRVTRRPDYGKLSHRTLEGMMAGARVEIGQGKDHPMDFTLWKASKAGEPGWDSPWGKGRPGWHIECSAMSLKYLGETLDIHGGGQDLIFPHHENEIAQSESYTGESPFVRFWVHNGLLQLDQTKMSKSLGNLVTAKEALAKYSADALRLFIITSYYRSPLNYTEAAVEAAERGVERWRNALTLEDGPVDSPYLDVLAFRARFVESMDDDLNTAQAVAVVFDLVRELNRGREGGMNIAQGKQLLRELTGVLGFTLRGQKADLISAEPFIGLLVQLRSDLRSAKQWALADRVRAQLTELGINLEDTPQGTRWKYSGKPQHP